MDFDKKDKEEDLNDLQNDEQRSTKELFDQIPEDVLSEFSEELSEPRMGFFERIINVFTSPREVMEDVKIKPYIGLLVLIYMVIGLLATLPTLSIMKDAMLEAMIEQIGSANIDSAMLDSIVNYSLITAIVASSIGSGIAPLISGVISHVVAILSGGEGKFKQTVGVRTMAYVVIMAGAILRVALVLVTDNMYASFSPAMFLGSNPSTNPYFGILSVIDIFNIISLYFVFIGIKIVHRVSNLKAWVITLFPTVLTVLISLLPLLFL